MGDEYSNRLSRIPGEVTEDIIIRPYVAGEAITAGDCVRLAVATEAASYTPGKTVMQGDANSFAVGVAITTAAAAGDIFHVQTWGRNVIAFTSGESLDESVVASLGAAGVTSEIAAGTSLEPESVLSMVGYGLAADSTAADPIGFRFICTFGGV